jgi:hypothetical protein
MHSSQKVQVLSELDRYKTDSGSTRERRSFSVHGWATHMNDGELEEDQCQELISIFPICILFYASLSISILDAWCLYLRFVRRRTEYSVRSYAFVKSFFRAGSIFILARRRLRQPGRNFVVRKSFRYIYIITLQPPSSRVVSRPPILPFHHYVEVLSS